MVSSCRPRLAAALTLLALLGLISSSAPAQPAKGKGDSKTVTFNSFDGVELKGTFWPDVSGRKGKDATVILLHNFDPRKGGSRSQDGWDSLGAHLQRDGYAALSFDFRGFGDSKTVDKNKFWAHKQNALARRGPKLTDAIDHKNFQANYYPYLANDIAAARAFLDDRNDAGECNTSSIVVIGAGEGATLGALWMESEFYRRRQKDPSAMFGNPALLDPEGRDLAAGVWLTISPYLGGRLQVPLQKWITDLGRTHKVPMAFDFGKGDSASANRARQYLKQINPSTKKLALTGEQAIEGTNLTGSALLQGSLSTEKWIVQTYLTKVMDERAKRLRVSREVRKNRWYSQPRGRAPQMVKDVGDEAPWVDVHAFMSR